MNERIKLLEKQCWDQQTNHLDTEKFAELIVRECAKVCDELQKWPSTEPRHCASDIRIHFGVEESSTKGETK